MYAATGGPNVKWGGHRFQMGGPGTTGPPAGDDPDPEFVSDFCLLNRDAKLTGAYLMEANCTV